jgi:SAM-dependent methyltransferase
LFFDDFVLLGEKPKLLPQHKFLDFGFGTLRQGVWLIRYLNPSQYYGVESDPVSAEIAEKYEVYLHGLEAKKPRFLVSESCEVDKFNTKFDRILAYSVFIWIKSDSERIACLRKMKSVLAEDGILLVNDYLPISSEEILHDLGLKVLQKHVMQSKILDLNVIWYEIGHR